MVIIQDIEVVEVDVDVVVVFVVVIMVEGMDIWGGVVGEPCLCMLHMVLDVSKCLQAASEPCLVDLFCLKCYNGYGETHPAQQRSD